MKITFVYSDHISDQYRVLWRCVAMANAINRSGLHQAFLLDMASFVKNDPAAQRCCIASDLIIICRYLVGPLLSAVERWKAMNKVVVLDMQDALAINEPDVASHPLWKDTQAIVDTLQWKQSADVDSSLEPLEEYRWGLRLIDAVTAPSAHLANLNNCDLPVFEVPDLLDLSRYLSLRRSPHEGVWVGLGGIPVSGSLMRKSGLAEALERVCAKHPEVKLMICGVEDELMGLENIPQEQKTVLGWVPAEDWPLYLSGLDIGLAPLNGGYDVLNGRQRLLEYMLMKIPWVASSHLPDRDERWFGWQVANTADAWEQAITEIINHLEAYHFQAEGEPYLFALGKDLDENIHKIFLEYEAILRIGTQVH